MVLEIDSVQRPFRKLRRVLKAISETPLPQDVHVLRTLIRRVEAIVLALQFEKKTSGNDLLRPLKPIRKAAGAVRDMDVLAALAASLDHGTEAKSLTQLSEYLGRIRAKAAGKLHHVVTARKKKLRRSLQRYVEENFHSSTTSSSDPQQVSTSLISASLQLEAELRSWSKLTTRNMHPFRIKVKELRSLLQLSQSCDPKLISALGKVKDRIGAWHDWAMLADIAENILHHAKERALRKRIRQRAEAEFARALGVTKALQALYLNQGTAQPQPQEGSPELKTSLIAPEPQRCLRLPFQCGDFGPSIACRPCRGGAKRRFDHQKRSM